MWNYPVHIRFSKTIFAQICYKKITSKSVIYYHIFYKLRSHKILGYVILNFHAECKTALIFNTYINRLFEISTFGLSQNTTLGRSYFCSHSYTVYQKRDFAYYKLVLFVIYLAMSHNNSASYQTCNAWQTLKMGREEYVGFIIRVYVNLFESKEI
jgi:hypothetical protein